MPTLIVIFTPTGFKNLIDSSIMDYFVNNKINNEFIKDYKKIDELPFDFKRKRLSILVEDKRKRKILICKGALEEVLDICNYYEIGKKEFSLDSQLRKKILEIGNRFSSEGYRVMAVAHTHIDGNWNGKISDNEKDLVFLGIMIFLDPPKKSAVEALEKLSKMGIEVKILTGDNEVVTKKIASDIGIKVGKILKGNEIEEMSNEMLKNKVEETTIFAKLSPNHKRRIVQALKENNHVVGFLGDGINDAPALRVADVGISVDQGVDIAKESASMILLEQDLNVLANEVIEGRTIFGNIMKYLKMGSSSNFGNIFSVLGASIFLPFLPMTSLQILLNNLLYDISQLAIPFDNVDEEYITVPRRWEIKNIGRFMIFFGPISSIFDYLTYFIMLYVFQAWNNPMLFRSGWFIESLTTQTLIVHAIRSRKIPFFQTVASWPLLSSTLIVISIGIFLVNSSFKHYFGFVKLPLLFWPILLTMNLSYLMLTQLMKSWYITKYGLN